MVDVTQEELEKIVGRAGKNKRRSGVTKPTLEDRRKKRRKKNKQARASRQVNKEKQ